MARIKQSRPRRDISPTHPAAAAIDIGATMHVAAVGPGQDPKPVRSFGTFTGDLQRLADWFERCGVRTVAMESTGVYRIPAFEILDQRGFEVVLVNARDAKHVPGRKTDISDAQWLQRLHEYGLLRASFRPRGEVATLRSYLRQRERLLDYAAAHKAARGELRRGLPVGFVWGEEEGEVCFHPDEAVVSAIRTVFARFSETGSARRVWLWLRSEGLKFPLQMHQGDEIRWVEASYTAIHHVLTNPVYAGAYAYGKTRRETILDAAGGRKKRLRRLPRSEWQVLIPDHHPGFLDWQCYESNQERIARNTRPGPHKASGAVREGSALLQGLASCGHCVRRLHTHYRGRKSSPGYHCPGKVLVEGRGVYCLSIGGIQIDEAVTRAFIAALEPAGLAATLAAAERRESDRGAALKQWRLGVERASYEAQRAERRYRAVDPDNRLVAHGLEREWEERLRALDVAKSELERRERQQPQVISQAERDRLLALGPDLAVVWQAVTTEPHDRKELLRTLVEEVIVKVERDKAAAHLTLRWKGGALDEIDLTLPRSRPATIRTDEDTIALVRRLAGHYPDSVIAGILNRQGRTTAYGHRFIAGRVGNLRRHWDIPCIEPTADPPEGELMTIKKVAVALGVAPSTIHRLLNDGIIAGEQLTPGAPWRIRLTNDLMARFNGEAGDGFIAMREAIRALGVSRQTVLQRVKRGELEAVHVIRGKQKGLRIKVIDRQPGLFDPTS